MTPTPARKIALFAVFTLVAAMGGCTSYRSPSIAVADATLAEVSDEAMRVELALSLHNPNSEPLQLLEFDYDVSIDGKPVFSGRRAAQATLAADGSRQLIIPAIAPLETLGWTPDNLPAEASYAVHGTLQYITPGEIAQILLDIGVRKPKASFDGAGEIELK